MKRRIGTSAAARWVVAGVALGGCATVPVVEAPPNFPAAPPETSPFPSLPEVRQMAEAPPPPPGGLFNDGAVDVAEWRLSGTLPDAMASVEHQPDSRFDALLAEVAAERKGQVMLSEAHHCAAREHGTFQLARDAAPQESITAFLAARCGVADGTTSFSMTSVKVPRGATELSIFQHLHDPVMRMLSGSLTHGPVSAGLWYGRKGNQVLVTLAVSRRMARLEPVPFVPGEGGVVTVRGELLDPADDLTVLVNQGRYGLARCTLDDQVALPRFVASCPTLAPDRSAWIDVLPTAPGRFVGWRVAHLLVFPGGQRDDTYRRPVVEGEGPMLAARADGSGLLGALNLARAEAGMQPLSTAPRQSETSNRLVPGFFDKLQAGVTDEATDRVALGLIAGWEVDGLVRDARFTFAVVRDRDRAIDVLAGLLESPSARLSVLDPRASQIAIGLLDAAEAHARAMLLTTYTLLDPGALPAEEKSLWDRLAAERARRHKPPPISDVTLNAYCRETANDTLRGGWAPRDGMRLLLDRIVSRQNWSARAFVYQTTALDKLTFSDELVDVTAPVGLCVSHYKPAGAAWGRYLIFAVMARATEI